MTTLHMETEKVQALAKMLDREATEMLSSISQMQTSASRLGYAWQGGGADDFRHDLSRLIKRMENQVLALQTLSSRISREGDEWLNVDRTNGQNTKATEVKLALNRDTTRREKEIRPDVHSEYILLLGSERRYYEGYLKGDLTFEEALKFARKDALANEYVKSSVTFYTHEEAGKLAWLDGQSATKYGDFAGSIGSIEGSIGADVKYKDGAFRADANAELGIYAAQGSYSASVAGVSVAAAGFLGAEAQAKTGIAFDPSRQEIGAKAELNAFAGAKVDGSVSKQVSVAGVDASATAKGALSYGIGATAKVDVGFSEGHLRSEIELGATLGLGAEFGISLDLNVQQAVTSIVDVQKKAVDWLFGP